MKIARLPHNDRTNGWSAILPAREATPTLNREITADWLVIGAGYAGLAAARRIAENCPDDRVALVEAGEVGENASGRNSGFAIDLPHTISSDLDQLEAAHRHMRLARGAIGELKRVVDAHAVDCDWSVHGKYHAAVTERGSRAILDPFAAELERLGEPFEWVEADDLKARLGTAHFHRAVYTPGCVLMNPAALTRGLAACLPDNVSLYENSPVIDIDYGNGVIAQTPAGSVRARRVVLATNGFTEQFGFLQNRFVHLEVHASLSRPLTEGERRVFAVEKPWGLTPANAFGGITMRYTNDHRLLIRQDIRVTSTQKVTRSLQQRMTRQHKALFDDRFPNLPDVTMDHTWTGYLCMSRNSAPAFGQLAPNVWVAACQNGIGVTKGTINGLLTADLACGRDNPLIEDIRSLGEPERLPPALLTAIGSRLTLGWEKWKNRAEN